MRTRWMLAGAVLATLLLGAVPNAQGPVTTLSACYNASGNVRLVGSAAACRSSETFVQWNVQGPQGAQGIQGIQGIQGPQGEPGAGSAGVEGHSLARYPDVPLGDTLAEVASMDVPFGNYTVSAVVQVGSYSELYVDCYLTLHNGPAVFNQIGQFSGWAGGAGVTGGTIPIMVEGTGDRVEVSCNSPLA